MEKDSKIIFKFDNHLNERIIKFWTSLHSGWINKIGGVSLEFQGAEVRKRDNKLTGANQFP